MTTEQQQNDADGEVKRRPATTPRAFLIEPAHKDISGAEEFGEIKEVFPRGSRRSSAFHPEEFGEDLVKKLADLKFDPLVDSIVLAGSLVVCCISMAAIQSKYGEFDVLMYESHVSKYVKKRITFQTRVSRN